MKEPIANSLGKKHSMTLINLQLDLAKEKEQSHRLPCQQGNRHITTNPVDLKG